MAKAFPLQQRNVVAMFRAIGYAVTGPWYEPSASRAEVPQCDAYWDSARHLPWLVVACTPCPGADERLQRHEVAAVFMCRNKHVHERRADRPHEGVSRWR